MLALVSCVTWVKSRTSHGVLILHIASKMEKVLLPFPGEGENVCGSWLLSIQ